MVLHGPNVNCFEKDLKDFVGQNKRVVALFSGGIINIFEV